ncbi:type II secretion system protein [Methylovorus sp. MM2]|uniref:type II secretion system protein n=1 Tax=Methylovorus sp. MM2 TaxID=1848038 RepID=UPI000B496B22
MFKRTYILRGFTLIELLVTLSLLALILTSAAPVMQLTVKRDKEQELKRSLWQIRDAIDAYKRAVDEGFIKKTPGQSGYPASLRTLVEGVENKRDPNKQKIYFLRSIPRDPFSTDLDISAEQTWRKRSYASSFDEPKEGDDIYDVYSSSQDIGLNERPYREW